MTKRIGIPGWMTGETSFGVNASYLDYIERFGKPVILGPMDSEDPPEVDLVIAPGGLDLSPGSYSAIPSYRTQKSNPMLEHFDAHTLPQYIERQTPIFAICRGMQRIWAMYGGKIDQHNPWHEQSKHQYEMCHELLFTDPFKDEYDDLIKKVTSRHHQCADASEYVPDELEVIAYAKAGHKQWWPSIVEIFRHRTLPIFAVQFHPEDHDSSDKLSTKIIKDFLA